MNWTTTLTFVLCIIATILAIPDYGIGGIVLALILGDVMLGIRVLTSLTKLKE